MANHDSQWEFQFDINKKPMFHCEDVKVKEVRFTVIDPDTGEHWVNLVNKPRIETLKVGEGPGSACSQVEQWLSAKFGITTQRNRLRVLEIKPDQYLLVYQLEPHQRIAFRLKSKGRPLFVDYLAIAGTILATAGLTYAGYKFFTLKRAFKNTENKIAELERLHRAINTTKRNLEVALERSRQEKKAVVSNLRQELKLTNDRSDELKTTIAALKDRTFRLGNQIIIQEAETRGQEWPTEIDSKQIQVLFTYLQARFPDFVQLPSITFSIDDNKFNPKPELKSLEPGKTYGFLLGILWSGGKTGHVNGAVLRPVDGKHKLVMFEPTGTSTHTKQEEIFNTIHTKLRAQQPNIMTEGSTNIGSGFCPQIWDEQKREPVETHQGYCIAWSLWFFSLMLENPETPVGELFQRAQKGINQGSPNYRSFIRQYAADIIKLSEM